MLKCGVGFETGLAAKAMARGEDANDIKGCRGGTISMY
jgi:hypothetical protein